MMITFVVFGRGMTRQTKVVFLSFQREVVCVMAVAAPDSRRVHLALQERAVDVHLVVYLSVRVVEAILQKNRLVVVQKIPARLESLFQLDSPRMASCTGIDGSLGLSVFSRSRITGYWIDLPD